jgi:hypothetical protein
MFHTYVLSQLPLSSHHVPLRNAHNNTLHSLASHFGWGGGGGACTTVFVIASVEPRPPHPSRPYVFDSRYDDNRV